MTTHTTARYALACDTAGADVRPRITNGLYLSETVRQALMGLARDEEGRTSELFAGKDEEGRPLRGHRHAYVLPCDDDDDGVIDHVVVHLRGGFGERELDTLGRLRKLWQHKNRPDLFPVLLGVGEPADYAGPSDRFGSRCPALERSRRWVSRTPYVLTRHPKRNGKDSPEAQVLRDLERLGLPAPSSIARVPAGCATRSKTLRWLEFARLRRQGEGRHAGGSGFGFRLVFEEPLEGPLALGYGAHFGLGLFVPEGE